MEVSWVSPLFLLVAIAQLFGNVAPQAGHCHHGDSALIDYDQPYCHFYRCDGGQQVRLVCTRTKVGSGGIGHATNGGNTVNIRAVLDNYYKWVLAFGETPLFLEVYGTTTTPVQTSVNLDMLGNSARLVHKLIIHTSSPGYFDTTVWTAMVNLRMLELKFTDGQYGAQVTTGFFAGAAALESLRLDTGPALVTFKPAMVELPSLRCFVLEGTGFKCDCTMMDFIRRSIFWRLNDTYYNPLMDDDMHSCGVHSAARCAIPAVFAGKPLNEFNMIDCPHVPASPNIHGSQMLRGSSVSCDFEHLRVKLENLGPTISDLRISFNDSTDPKCQGQISRGIVSLDAHAKDCGTDVSINNVTREVTISNTVFISKATPAVLNSHQPVVALPGYKVPVQCKLTLTGNLSQPIHAPMPYYPQFNWKGQVRIKLDVLPHVSILGDFTFDITLDTAHRGAWSISVENCWATPDADPANIIRYDIIQNGCYRDKSLRRIDSGSDQQNQWSRQTFSMSPFQFVNAATAEVHIHCEVLPCSKANNFCKATENERCKDLDAITTLAPVIKDAPVDPSSKLTMNQEPEFSHKIIGPLVAGKISQIETAQ